MLQLKIIDGKTTRTLDCVKGETIFECLKRNNIYIESPCNGNGTCGKCKVILDGKTVLSCVEKIYENTTVKLFEKNIEAKSLATENVFALDTTSALSIKKYFVPEIKNTENISWKKRFENIFGKINFNILKNLKPKSGMYSGVYLEEKLIAIIEGETDKVYSVAIDIGTTTIALVLVDALSKKIVNVASAVNTQVEYGSDVLTRIAFANESEANSQILHEKIITQIETSIKEMCEQANVNIEKVFELVISANSLMTHIFLDCNVGSIGLAPYKNLFSQVQNCFASEVGLHLGQHTRVFTLPLVSSYIGGDIVSGASFLDLEKNNGTILFVDIGTNTEIILKHEEKLFATSCAAGPALEGMNITFGSRAINGAIEDVHFDLSTGKTALKVIADCEPISICGSGILAIIREALKANLINTRGKLINIEDLPSDDMRKNFLTSSDNKTAIKISDNIYVTKKDIRNVQLAKTAIHSGIKILLNEYKLDENKIDAVFIAGQFGKHLTKDELLQTGILPDIPEEKIFYKSNTSLDGAIEIIFDVNKRKNLNKLRNKINFIDLSTLETYQKFFIESSNFPTIKNKN